MAVTPRKGVALQEPVKAPDRLDSSLDGANAPAAASQRVQEFLAGTLRPHTGPEAVEGLGSISATTRLLDPTVKDNGVLSVDAFILNQRPLEVNLAQPGHLHSQQLCTETMVGPLTSAAHSHIIDTFAAKGLNPLESSVIADLMGPAIMVNPPLSAEAYAALGTSAQIAASRIVPNMTAQKLDPSQSEVVKVVKSQGLVHDRVDPSLAIAV